MNRLLLYIDGASRGNPGSAAIGISIADEYRNEIEAISESIGHATNNEAEYRALLRGMERATALRASQIEIRTDSELLARQLKGAYKMRAANLKPLWDQAQRAMNKFKRVNIVIVPRTLNKRADALANQALDEISDPHPNPLSVSEKEQSPSPHWEKSRNEGSKSYV